MAFPYEIFDESIARQIEIHKARTPTERFQALCDLLDALSQTPLPDPRLEPFRRELAEKIANREKSHAELRRFLSAHTKETPPIDSSSDPANSNSQPR